MSVLVQQGAADFAALLRARARGYLPEWEPGTRGAGAALIEVAAHDLATVGQRLEQAPAKNELAFLETLGVRLVPAQPARAPLVVVLTEDAADVRMAAGTRVAAAPPLDATTQVSFETEHAVGIAVARLREVRTLWPGRDQSADHSAAVAAGAPVTLFDPLALEDTPHALYLAHDRLLALTGSSVVTVTLELLTGSSEPLDLRWEAFDGSAWRPFRAMRPACSNGQAAVLDSTGGLRRSGSYRLESECAQTAATTVAGIEARWIRARLAQTLPPDPARVLPEVGAVRIAAEISHAYEALWAVSTTAAGEASLAAGREDTELLVRVRDATGVPMAGVEVGLLDDGGFPAQTADDGRALLDVVPGVPATITVEVDGFQQQQLVTVPEGVPLDVAFTLDMGALDFAVAEGTTVDLTKPFAPFGAQPRPGSAFYFSCAEAFAKPGARVRLYLQPAATPQDAAGAGTALAHTVSWEYFDGTAWTSLRSETQSATATPADLRARGTVELVVPDDLQPTTVAEQTALWMRVRLVQGGYGTMRTVTVGPAAGDQLSFFVPQPPSLADVRLGYTWQDGPRPAEHVVAHNDFRYADHTAAASWPGTPWRPLEPVSDQTPALYLGFDRALPVDDLGLWIDVAEERGAAAGPRLIWEYGDGLGWQRLSVADETRELRVPGILSLLGPEDLRPMARFGEPRFWLRGRLAEDGHPGTPTIRALLPNATWVTQRQTVVDEPLGEGIGAAGQVLPFRQVPVLPGQRIEVRELAGPRANVEWRILATGLLPDGETAVEELERWLAAEGDQTEVQAGPLRLIRDRLKHVTEAWVAWEERPSLGASGPEDRHYALDRARGRLHLGARAVPAGAAVSARRYCTGGGGAGNVPARAIMQLLGPIGGVEEVYNPAAAEGGADTETAAQVLVRGPLSLRARGRGVTARDLEALALEASPSVAVARALPARDGRGRPAPGWVTLVITPRSAEPQPTPTAGLRDAVRRYVAARACGAVPDGRLVVVGPAYQPVDVAATLVPVVPAEAGAVERAALTALRTFLHPLLGAPGAGGWRPGQGVYASDVAAVLGHVPGVDRITELALLRAGAAIGEHLELGADRIPVAGTLRLRLAGG